MGHADRASFAGYSENWAEDHAEGDFDIAADMRRAHEQAAAEGDLEDADDGWFEDDLQSLIRNRPSRQARRPAAF
jgi:hypothetical protein